MEVAMEDVQDHSESAPVMSSEHSEQDQGHEDTPDLNSPNAANVSTPSFSTLSPTGVPNQENLSNNPEESPMEQRNQPSMFRAFTFSYDFATAERARNGAMPNRSISFAEGDAATPSHGSSGLFRGSQRVLNRSMSSFTQDGSRQGHGDLQSRSNSMLLGVSPIRQRHISPMPRSRSSVGYRYRRALPVSSGSEMERLSTSFPGSSFDTGLISPLTQQHRYNDNFSDNLSRDNTTVSSTPSEGLPPNSRQQQEHAERQDSWYRISSSFVRLFRAVSNDVTNTEQQQQQQEQTQDRPDASHPITTTAATATRNIVPSDTAPATAAPSPQHQHQHQHRSPQQSNTAINARCPSFSEDGDPEDLLCPICREIFREVTVTSCGHTFCNLCITQYLATANNCPLCRARLSNQNLYPNFQFNKLAEQYREGKESSGKRMFGLNPNTVTLKPEILQKAISASLLENVLKHMTYQDASELMQEVLDKKRRQEDEEKLAKVVLLEAFLKQLKEKHESTITKLQEQMGVIESDLRRTREQLPPPEVKANFSEDAVPSQPGDSHTDHRAGAKRKIEEVWGLFETAIEETQGGSSKVQSKKQRIFSRFEDLQEQYIEGISSGQTSLEDFSSILYQTTRFNNFRVLDTIYHTDTVNGSSIVSSIDFDRDDEYFAVGGVSKDIRIYDFSMIADGTQMAVDEGTNAGNRNPSSGFIGPNRAFQTIHCPVKVIDVGYKLSCLSWSQYLKFQLASSDYEGIIRLWDVNVGQCTRLFDEHERRTWSVDICTANPTYIASGSDDATVKVWSTTCPRSIMTLQHNGNVCCAKFAPTVANLLAVGTADHETSCYDLRYANAPVHVFRGHKKAVSYVRWIGDNQIVSASTDSTLKRWNLDKHECVMTYSGHLNEKNFVGLTITDDWIACGSETNCLYGYHKDSRSPVAMFNFPTTAPMSAPDAPQFVSSTCWKRNTKTILAASSKGVIKVLQLDS